jgi:hypothetical protein
MESGTPEFFELLNITGFEMSNVIRPEDKDGGKKYLRRNSFLHG